MILAHVWDPYHGDPNNRHQRLGALRPRRIERAQWRTFNSIQPAIYGNGIFADLNACDAFNHMTRDQRAQTSIVNNDRRVIARRKHASEDRRDIARRAFSLEPEPRSE